jgi:hypothetical protein
MEARQRCVRPHIRCRSEPAVTGPIRGKKARHWVVERTDSRHNNFRALRIRREKIADNHFDSNKTATTFGKSNCTRTYMGAHNQHIALSCDEGFCKCAFGRIINTSPHLHKHLPGQQQIILALC